MKNALRQSIIIFFMFLVLILSGLFMYKAYETYKRDQIIQKSDVYVAFLEQIDTVVLALEHERLLSALYIGLGGKTDFHQLSLDREKNDTLIQELKQFLTKNPNILENKIALKNITNNLQYVRSRVDVVNSDFQDILFKYYHDEIIKPLLASSSALIQQLGVGIPFYKQSLKAYSDLQRFRNDLSLEEGYIAFLLSRSQKVPMHDLVLWEKILAHEKIPVSSIVELPKFKSKLSDLRIAVLKGVSNGNFAISVTSWLANMDTLIHNIILSQQAVYKKLQEIDYNDAASGNFISKLILAFVSLLGFLWLYFLLRYTKKLPNPKSDNPNIHIKHLENKKPKAKINIVKNVNINAIPKTQEMPKNKIQSEESIQLKSPVISTPSDDLPLSNMQPIVQKLEPEKSIDFDSAAVLPSNEVLRREDKTFYALDEFKSIIKTFMIDADIKNVDFHYDIDSSIPEICIGDIDKIKQFLKIFLQYAIHVTPSKELVVLQIENIAQKKFESAINFTIKDSGRFIDEDERRKIRRGVASHHTFLPDVMTHDKDKTDLSLASRLVSLLDGRLEIKSEQQKGTSFSITLNLKKFIVAD